MRWLCNILGIHSWTDWSDLADAGRTYSSQIRRCLRCNRVRHRYIGER